MQVILKPMKQMQKIITNSSLDEENIETDFKSINPDLIIIFGSVSKCLAGVNYFRALQKLFPNSSVIGCSTAGEISNDGVHDETLVVNAIQFESIRFKVEYSLINGMNDSFNSGKILSDKLNALDLKAIFLIGQGVEINGSSLIDGLRDLIDPSIIITGGLAADGGKFERTYVIFNGELRTDLNIGIGFYGDNVGFAHGSFGGWQPFGPARLVTKASDNILYELDGKPALDLYKKYLGQYAKDLPGVALLYPLAILDKELRELGIIRTILGIKEEDSSLILAGDIPEDGFVKLMHANTNLLVEGAEVAATQVMKKIQNIDINGLSILISCVGRKLAMGERTEEEIEAVRSIIGKENLQFGFYSNGEISPYITLTDCKLHNQTMTITHIYEKK